MVIMIRIVVHFLQDGQIDYNEFVSMMQQGNSDFDIPSSFNIGFREAMPVY